MKKIFPLSMVVVSSIAKNLIRSTMIKNIITKVASFLQLFRVNRYWWKLSGVIVWRAVVLDGNCSVTLVLGAIALAALGGNCSWDKCLGGNHL